MLLLEGHTATVYALAFSPDGQFLVSGTKNGDVWLWDEELQRRDLWNHKKPINSLEFHPNGETIVMASDAGTIGLRNIVDGGLKEEVQFSGVIAARYLSPALLAVGYGDRAKPTGGGLELWDVAADEWKEPRFSSPHGVRAVATHPGRNLVAWSEWGAQRGAGPRLSVWEITKPQPVRFNLSHNCPALAFHPDGELLAAAVDYTVRVFDLTKRQERFTLKGHTGRVSGVAFSPDGRTLASASWDGSVRWWDVATGAEKMTFHWPIGRVFALAYSPDGLRLAAGGDKGNIMLWDVE